jgi:hypothetical protein
MKLQDQLDERREASSAKRPAEVNATIARALQALRDSGIAERALGVGDLAPAFSLPNAVGRKVALGDLLARGPVTLAFYRGVW